MAKKRETKRFGDEVKPNPEPEEPKTEKGLDYEAGQIYANVKVVDIKPDVDRSIHFIEAKRNIDGKPELKGVYNKKGDVIGQQVAWEDKVHSMTKSDFEAMVKARTETGGILPNLG